MRIFVRRHRRLVRVVGVLAAIGLLLAIPVAQYQRPVPGVKLVAAQLPTDDAPATVSVFWPPQGESAVSIIGVGALGESPGQEAAPIASLVKVMTAYVILKDHPLNRGDPGPEVQVQSSHVQDYRARLANGESVVAVTAGSKLTERQLLRGLLLASGNNLADILAEWDAGNVDAFIVRMNEEAASLGMKDTKYADAAGLLPTSVSTARDQVILATAAMAQSQFAVTVAEKQADIPGAGVVFNTDSQLGISGIIGIKTGWTEDAGACFIFAANTNIDGEPITVIGAVLGQNTLNDAFARSRALIDSARSNARIVKVGEAGQAVGQIKSRWGQTVDAQLANDVNLVVLPGTAIKTKVTTNPATTVRKGDDVGTVHYLVGDQRIDVPVKASASVAEPGLGWRLTRLR